MHTGRMVSAVLAVLASGSVLLGACADEDGRTPPLASEAPQMSLPGVAAGARAPATPASVVVKASQGAPARSQAPIFYRYEVKDGDTVDAIARRFGIRPESVVWNNEGVLRSGEVVVRSLLDIPSVDGIIHRVQAGETLNEIAARYHVEVQTIIDFPANGAPTGAVEGSTILVPGGRWP